MKNTVLIVFLFIAGHCFSQADTALKAVKKPDSSSRRNTSEASDTAKATLAVKDTTAQGHSGPLQQASADTARGKVAQPPAGLALDWKSDTAFARLLTFRHVVAAPALHEGQRRAPAGKDQLFYLLAALLLLGGAVKAAYPKYFRETFRLFIQTSQRQKQTPEQIVQGYAPAFFFNMLFYLTGGLLITLYGQKNGYLAGPLWLMALYCAGILAAIYLLKYAVTALAGLVFNVKEAAGMYSFIVFIINRVAGLFLLPLLILIAFYDGDTNTVLFTVAASLVFFLLVYRYALSLTIIRKNLKVSALHFFIYLCAVELMPLLVIYKELFNYVHANK